MKEIDPGVPNPSETRDALASIGSAMENVHEDLSGRK